LFAQQNRKFSRFARGFSAIKEENSHSPLLQISVAHPTHASCYLIRLTYDLIPGKMSHISRIPLSRLLPRKKKENLMSEKCSQTKARNGIRLMRFSSGKQ